MKKSILAKKVGMTQIFNEDGVLTPVTVLQAGPCVVTQVKTADKDGYDAVQVGFEDIREKLVTKGEMGVFLVQVASQFRSDIYLISGNKRVNAKSIMGMMSLGLIAGEDVTVTADGSDEKDAVSKIEKFLTKID